MNAELAEHAEFCICSLRFLRRSFVGYLAETAKKLRSIFERLAKDDVKMQPRRHEEDDGIRGLGLGIRKTKSRCPEPYESLIPSPKSRLLIVVHEE